MKIMFISDLHGSLYYTKKMVEAFKRERADRLIILGDILYHGPRNPLPKDYNPKEVSKLLNKYYKKIIAIRGNCDSEVDQMVLEFDMMQTASHLLIDQHHFFLTHGHQYGPEQLPKVEENCVIISGHTHIMMLKKQDGYILLNPGSISIPKGGNPCSYAIYENNTLAIKTFENETIHSMNLPA